MHFVIFLAVLSLVCLVVSWSSVQEFDSGFSTVVTANDHVEHVLASSHRNLALSARMKKRRPTARHVDIEPVQEDIDDTVKAFRPSLDKDPESTFSPADATPVPTTSSEDDSPGITDEDVEREIARNIRAAHVAVPEKKESAKRIAVLSINANPTGNAGGDPHHRKTATGRWMHRLSYINKVEYCKRWGIDLIIEDNEIVDPTRDVAWSKIPALRKWLPHYEWVMWMDMDALFMRFDISLETIVGSSSKNMIVTNDWHGINLGIFFVRNSPFSFQMLNDLWNTPRAWWVPWEEQSAMMALLDPKKKGKVAHRYTANVEVMSQRSFNSYPMQFSYNNPKSLYRKGDFIAHFPNCKSFANCRKLVTVFAVQSNDDNHVSSYSKDAVIPEHVLPEQT